MRHRLQDRPVPRREEIDERVADEPIVVLRDDRDDASCEIPVFRRDEPDGFVVDWAPPAA